MNWEVVPDSGPCARCQGVLYFAVKVSHATMGGKRVLGLCPRCDAADGVSQELLAWGAIYGRVDLADAECRAMVERWVAARQRVLPGVSSGQNADDEDAFYRGEFDA